MMPRAARSTPPTICHQVRLMLDEKGKNSGGDIVYEAVRAAKKQNIQVYAVINTTYIAESLGIASEDHPAVYEQLPSPMRTREWRPALEYLQEGLHVRPDITRELCYDSGVWAWCSMTTAPVQTMAKVFSAIDQAVDRWAPARRSASIPRSPPRGWRAGDNALNAFVKRATLPTSCWQTCREPPSAVTIPSF